ncbi:hypothetical protein, partial [Enterococcus casseliflavus]|uniref:hypothetical protein n=1 Tax=Enterococcus casseliflavus TaxID=37734 RepID=UPI003D12D268
RELLHAHLLERGQVHDLGVGLALTGFDHLDVFLGSGPVSGRMRLLLMTIVAAAVAVLTAVAAFTAPSMLTTLLLAMLLLLRRPGRG